MATELLLKAAANPIKKLTTETGAQWGRMTPQHMIEHLIIVLKISNGKLRLKQAVSDEEVQLRRKFLMSDMMFEKNIKNPLLGDELPKLRNASLDEARDKFLEEIDDFYNFFKENPDSKPAHPLFGELYKSEWERFHLKHFTHHFSQFGLL
jgi:oxepin-CoA hydrolase/3-oxo-5,6-dehydrosuberyl-CoA semialdehyde dehydrogenase